LTWTNSRSFLALDIIDAPYLAGYRLFSNDSCNVVNPLRHLCSVVIQDRGSLVNDLAR
jgi:hypothetical protein